MNAGSFVHPSDVAALKNRLHGAFVALHGAELEPEAVPASPRALEALDLIHAWNAYFSRPADWLNAPTELEQGFELEARLAMLQGDHVHADGGHHRAGEVLGMHTVGELSDLRDALSYTVGQLTAAYNECAELWKAADAESHDPWKADFDAALQRFGRDWDAADLIIKTLPDWLPFSDAIPGVLPSAASSAWTAIVSDIHEFTDLDRRVRLARVCTGPTYANMPQPTHSDLDLKLFNLSGDILSGVKEGAHSALSAITSPVPWIALGGLLAIVLVSQLRR
jgi:hypothetical protein